MSKKSSLSARYLSQDVIITNDMEVKHMSGGNTDIGGTSNQKLNSSMFLYADILLSYISFMVWVEDDMKDATEFFSQIVTEFLKEFASKMNKQFLNTVEFTHYGCKGSPGLFTQEYYNSETNSVEYLMTIDKAI